MSASLVGSEMCIRDRTEAAGQSTPRRALQPCLPGLEPKEELAFQQTEACLLYTSDAADDM
eukprot:2725232-Alexandrium_andersonii.AAC.1